MTRRIRFVQYDVFTSVPFGGNQLAVFTDASALSGAEMQTIAREMNYSESTFILPATDPKAAWRVRIFTPGTELPFAGHPVVGTTFALAAEGMLPANETPAYLQLGVGTLPVDLLYEEQRLSFVWMHQPVPEFSPWQGDRPRLAAALGLSEDDLLVDLPIERASLGVVHMYVPVRSLDAVSRAHPTADLVDAVGKAEPLGVNVFTLERPASGNDIHVRMFAPSMGITEDPATGSAAGPLGVYLLRHGHIHPDETGVAQVRVEQGVEMGRPSLLSVAIAGTPESVQEVRVGGEAVLVAEGHLLLS
jgi:trans-2,3-dihydro-3-hydroxyanthranilate isomerase